MNVHDLSWYFMVIDDNSCQKFHEIPWKYHGKLWNFMHYTWNNLPMPITPNIRIIQNTDQFHNNETTISVTKKNSIWKTPDEYALIVQAKWMTT